MRLHSRLSGEVCTQFVVCRRRRRRWIAEVLSSPACWPAPRCRDPAARRRSRPPPTSPRSFAADADRGRHEGFRRSVRRRLRQPPDQRRRARRLGQEREAGDASPSSPTASTRSNRPQSDDRGQPVAGRPLRGELRLRGRASEASITASRRRAGSCASPPATFSGSRDGKIAEHWGMGDIAGVLAQLKG